MENRKRYTKKYRGCTITPETYWESKTTGRFAGDYVMYAAWSVKSDKGTFEHLTGCREDTVKKAKAVIDNWHLKNK